MAAAQRITASVSITGQQHIVITSHDRGSGSYISVSTGLVMVTMFDTAAALTYTGAWLAPQGFGDCSVSRWARLDMREAPPPCP